MMKWWDLWEMAASDARVDTAVHWLNPTDGMIWLSEARHKYQEATNVLKKNHAIALDPNSADGSYDVPADYKHSISASYQATANMDFVPVDRRSYEYYERVVHAASVGPIYSADSMLPQTGTTLTLAEAYNKFWVYPFKGASGTLNVRYVPNCIPFSVSDSTNWPGYGMDPTAAMQANGPEQEFAPVLLAMKDYCLAKILKKKPLRSKQDDADRNEAMLSFLEGEQRLRRKNTDYANETPPPVAFGPVQ